MFFLSFPYSTQAFWWGNDESTNPSLNFESGYDVNTITIVSGKILSIQTGTDRPNIQLEIEDEGAKMMVFLGPQRYWLKQGLSLHNGDEVVVRGSKAQGQDGVIYILAQEITEISQGIRVILRDETGCPNWAGGRMGRGNGGGRGGGGSGHGNGGGGNGGNGGGGGGGGGGR